MRKIYKRGNQSRCVYVRVYVRTHAHVHIHTRGHFEGEVAGSGDNSGHISECPNLQVKYYLMLKKFRAGKRLWK